MTWLSLDGASVTDRLFMLGGAAMGLLAYLWVKQLFGGLLRRLPDRHPPTKPKPKPKKTSAKRRR